LHAGAHVSQTEDEGHISWTLAHLFICAISNRVAIGRRVFTSALAARGVLFPEFLTV
jgi:hypothetical protein